MGLKNQDTVGIDMLYYSTKECFIVGTIRSLDEATHHMILCQHQFNVTLLSSAGTSAFWNGWSLKGQTVY